jgi:hypothetical protein
MSKRKVKPIEYMIQFKKTIIDAYQKNARNSEKAWQHLCLILPELKQVMKKNTFKQYMTVLLAFCSELDRINNESDKIKKELELLKNEQDNKPSHMSNYPEKKLDRVRQNSNKVRQKLDRNLKIIGWNVRKSNDGYYRCYRKINNKVHCVYIGKQLDQSKAMKRIADKELQIRLDRS